MTDRHCSVSINAYMTLPRLGQMVQSTSNGNVQANGIRFEYSWSNSVPDLSPTPNRRSASTARAYHPPPMDADANAFRCSHRKNSSSGYGSGETPAPVMAATLTVSHPAGSSSSVSGDSGRRATQPYERRCRSTCSITLQTNQENPVESNQTAQEAGSYPLYPHNFRRCSEGETWNSHTKMPPLSVPPPVQSPCPVLSPLPASPVTSSTPVGKVKRRKDGKKGKGRERPRTVHIDVYCTASESETETCLEESDESNESNTSTGQTVLRADQPGTRVRHIRKKTSLPNGLTATKGCAPGLKPVLSYRISTKELAEAVERKRVSSKTTDASSDLLDDELFRNLTLTDSSVVSLLADSEPESSDTRFSEDSYLDAKESDKTWRSPEKERKRKMLEQRKQQWRAAKSAEQCEESARFASRAMPTRPPSSPDNSLLGPAAYDLREKFKMLGHSGSGGSSDKVSRCNSQRCPVLDKSHPSASREFGASSQSPRPESVHISSPSPSYCSSVMGSSIVTDSNSSTDVPVDQLAVPTQFEMPWQWRIQQPTSPVRSPISAAPSNWTLKKFGRHVGPARNPDCSCAHCLDHFARLRSIPKSGGMIRS